VLGPLGESPRRRGRGRGSSFFGEEGFRPAGGAPGVSSSVGVAGSFAALLGDAVLGGFGSDRAGMSCDGSPDSRC